MTKRRMMTDYEKLTYSTKMLREAWVKKTEFYQKFVDGGLKLTPILELVKYITESKYSKVLFPGSSHDKLLINKPDNGRLNYDQTLSIYMDRTQNRILFEYKDSNENHPDQTSIDKSFTIPSWLEVKNQSFPAYIAWNKKSGPEGVIDAFEEFVTWKNNWD